MSGTIRHVINMANSIIGVSILSMPYCFKEAGLVLGVVLILFSGFITKKTCMFLIRAAIMSRRRSYELLAFQVFGVTGKLLMEMCMILFLIGICISFHVVMGDLAPAIVAKYMVIENSPSLRCTLLVGMVLLVILPLCLLRNLDSLASMSACSIGFYVFLNCIIFYMALPNLLDGSWFAKAKLFHFDSAFRVLPIMTLALSCQSNVFEIYDSIPDPDVIKMKNVVSQAVNICCALYIGVGFLGYIAFIDTDVTGNAILKFPVSHMTDCITIFFVVSLAISFPLMLFPCRTSIHSLCYKRNTQISYDLVGNYMPESRFKGITVSVLLSSLIIGILLPNIEFVLGLLGSTMGVTIALILPSVFYIKVYTKTSCDRLLAQGFMLMGIFIMVTGTYLHLSGLEGTGGPVTLSPEIKKIDDLAKNIGVKDLPPVPAIVDEKKENIDADLTGRKEPAIPEPPNSDQETGEKKVVAEAPLEKKEVQEDILVKNINSVLQKEEEQVRKPDEAKIVKKDVKEEDKMEVEKKEEVLHPDAIKKEEKENMEESFGKANIEDKQEEILKKMEHQQKEQKKLIEEQKKILQELKVQKEKIEEVQKEKIGEVQKEKIEIAQKKSEFVPKEKIEEQKQIEEPQVRPELKPVKPLNMENEILDKPLLKEPKINISPNLEILSPKLEKIPQKQNQNIDEKSKGKLPQLPVENLISMPLENFRQMPVEKLPKKAALENPKVEMRALNLDSNPVKDNLAFGSSLQNNKNSVVNNIEASPQEVNLPQKSEKAAQEGAKLNPQPSLGINKLLNSGNVKSQKPLEDSPPLKIGKKLPESNRIPETGKLSKIVKDVPENNKVPKEVDGLRHDEERRKRDVSSLLEERKEITPLIQGSESLSFNADVNLVENKEILAKENKDIVDALFETRHLLWLKKGRRKKRRNEQFPEYWDEI